MTLEPITERDDLVIRRMTLEPGEQTFWHTDPCHRFTVVVRGQRLTIEFRDGDPVDVPVEPGMAGMAGWDEPDDRVHRAVNTGSCLYEEVVTFYRTGPRVDPQPISPAPP